MAVWILAVIFSFVCAIVFMAETEHTKREKEKIEAELHREEMRRGFTPGSYSDSVGNGSKEYGEALERSRAKLESGLLALKKRIGTMNSKN